MISNEKCVLFVLSMRYRDLFTLFIHEYCVYDCGMVLFLLWMIAECCFSLLTDIWIYSFDDKYVFDDAMGSI